MSTGAAEDNRDVRAALAGSLDYLPRCALQG
jgi:hypothetical protein